MKIQYLLLAATLSLASAACTVTNVTNIAADDQQGRNNNTQGSINTQKYLIKILKLFADGPNSAASGDDAYKQPFTNGTNILGVIPGTDLAHEYVMVGAHYDHIGLCAPGSPDPICNGATDNATGVAATIDIGLALADPANPPRRSVILAFWDREEDGLLGSAHYTANPLVPNSALVAYINFDIQGANLLPSLRQTSFAIAAETGGAAFENAVQASIDSQPLASRRLSSVFGQGRSDYINFINQGVPSVFFSDSTGGCYHTARDDISIVDFDKLAQQTAIARNLTEQLASGALTPTFTTAATATYNDALVIQSVVNLALVDLPLFSPTNQSRLLAAAATVDNIVAAGPGAFPAFLFDLLLASVELVEVLTLIPCNGFLLPPPP